MTDQNIQPLVTVVIPVYNPDIYFTDAINSVLRQSYDNYEVIISDDSEEKSSLIPEDLRIMYVKNISGKKGIFPNLNNAIRHAKGDFIQIFCQDDVMDSKFITSQINCFKISPLISMVFSDYFTIRDNAKIADFDSAEPKYADLRFYRKDFFLNKLLVKGSMPGNLSPVMVKRNIFDDIGYFDESFIYCGDHEYWIRLSKSHNAFYSGFKLLYIRVHKGQASQYLPQSNYFKEEQLNYLNLTQCNTIKKSPAYINWYINERFGVQHFYNLVKSVLLKKQFKNLQNLRVLNSYPFRLYKIVILFFMSFRNKITLFKINEKYL